jgi:hypothetical protein
MYARIARFEGGIADDIVAEAEEMRRDIAAVGRGGKDQYFANELTDRVGRMEIMVDRGQGSVAVLVYCESQADARKVERIMDGMSPHRGGWGKRVSSEVYEVVLDEVAGRQAV